MFARVISDRGEDCGDAACNNMGDSFVDGYGNGFGDGWGTGHDNGWGDGIADVWGVLVSRDRSVESEDVLCTLS